MLTRLFTGSYSAQAVIYVRNCPWGGGNTVRWSPSTGTCIQCLGAVLSATRTQEHNFPPYTPLSLSCNTTRLRIEGLSKDFRSRPGLACSSISQILTPQYAIICTVQGIARQTGKRYRGEGCRYLGVHTRTSPPCTPHPCHLCGCGPAHLYRRVAARCGCVLPVCLSIASMSLPLTAQSTLL